MWLIRTRRLLFTIGVLLAVLSAGQWARAQFVHEWFRWLKPRVALGGGASGTDKPATAYVIELNGYGLALKRFDCWMRTSEPFAFEVLRAPPRRVRWSQVPLRLTRLAFNGSTGSVDNNPFVVVPYWAICVMGAGPMAAWMVLERRRRRRADTLHCRACGYDLRATPERCPECGALPPQGEERLSSSSIASFASGQST
jgi:hypothetical protein